MFKKIFAAAACALFVCSAAFAYEEGTDYTVLDQPKTAEPEVREFFSYFCGHCFQMQKPFKALRDHVGSRAKFEMNPVNVLGGDMGPASESAYAVAKVSGVEDAFSDELFERIHVKNDEPRSSDYFYDLLESVGVPRDKARRDATSFVVKGMITAWDRNLHKFNIEAVPEIFVNGKYRVNMDKLETEEQLNKVVDYLLTL